MNPLDLAKQAAGESGAQLAEVSQVYAELAAIAEGATPKPPDSIQDVQKRRELLEASEQMRSGADELYRMAHEYALAQMPLKLHAEYLVELLKVKDDEAVRQEAEEVIADISPLPIKLEVQLRYHLAIGDLPAAHETCEEFEAISDRSVDFYRVWLVGAEARAGNREVVEALVSQMNSAEFRSEAYFDAAENFLKVHELESAKHFASQITDEEARADAYTDIAVQEPTVENLDLVHTFAERVGRDMRARLLAKITQATGDVSHFHGVEAGGGIESIVRPADKAEVLIRLASLYPERNYLEQAVEVIKTISNAYWRVASIGLLAETIADLRIHNGAESAFRYDDYLYEAIQMMRNMNVSRIEAYADSIGVMYRIADGLEAAAHALSDDSERNAHGGDLRAQAESGDAS